MFHSSAKRVVQLHHYYMIFIGVLCICVLVLYALDFALYDPYCGGDPNNCEANLGKSPVEVPPFPFLGPRHIIKRPKKRSH